MSNKYAIGTDNHNNYIFDYTKVYKDMKDFLVGKKKMNKSLYDVMNLRFTIAHYNMFGWVDYYNGRWSLLAKEIQGALYWFDHDSDDINTLQNLVNLLMENDSVVRQ